MEFLKREIIFDARRFPGRGRGWRASLKFLGNWPRAAVFIASLSLATLAAADAPAPDGPLWKNSAQPLAARVADLVGRMTPTEKVRQICNRAPAVPRLGVPAYDYWNESLHGVARNGVATVFPQAIGMAAAWDPALLHTVADVIATEARAKNRAYTEAHDGDSANYTGLTFWSPNINIFRDPRWGRGQETYGEDPFLTAQLGVAFIQGLQGDDPKYFKAVACAKHFAVHSGPESVRHSFNSEPPERDLYETYLPQFEAAVREGHVGGVMGAYNRLGGIPACADHWLLTELLRQQWGFDGYVVSDCGAVYDMVMFHKYAPTFEVASAEAVKAGCDLTCGSEYQDLTNAVQNGLLSANDLDTALGRLLTVRFRLGLFDPPSEVAYAQIPVTENDTPAHGELALRMARESIVLLKNDGVLPLDRTKVKRLVVIGADADSVPLLQGNYFGTPSHPVTILNGIWELAGKNTEVIYEPGCPLSTFSDDTNQVQAAEAQKKALATARTADAIIYVGGLSPSLEGEDLHVAYDGFHGGDRTRIELADVQTRFLKKLQATGKPVVFVNCSGGAVAMPWVARHIPAIVQAWYPGQAGGTAVAEVLFGAVNPAGRLPVTFYGSTKDLPPFTSYAMANRTYRYFTGRPQFAFGHGLSYTTFEYQAATLDRAQAGTNETIRVNVNVTNSGGRDGDEVVQVYFRHVKPAVPQPREALCGFRRVPVPRGQTVPVEIEVPVNQFRYWDTAKKQYVVEPGRYEILVGAAADDLRARLPLEVTAPK